MSLENEANPRIKILRREVEEVILQPMRSSGWTAKIVYEHDAHSSLEISATKQNRTVGIGILYSSGTANSHYKDMAQRVEYIFHYGMPYELDSFTYGLDIPVEALSNFLPTLFALNKEFEPDCTPVSKPRPKLGTRRIVEEKPLQGILNRLQQFTSVNLANKLVVRRAEHEKVILNLQQINDKATGIAFSMRSALDYIESAPDDRLNKRILSLYYGSVAFAFAEMLASPSGPSSLDEVEQMTKFGHGLYTYTSANEGFSDIHVGVLSTGFLPRWLSFLGHDIAQFPKKKPRTADELKGMPDNMHATFEQLFSSMPEIYDLFSEVFGASPGWIVPVYNTRGNHVPTFPPASKKAESTYVQLIDHSGLISINRIRSAGWPIAEIKLAEEQPGKGQVFNVRVDHAGYEYWWGVMPVHHCPFTHSRTLIFPILGRMREYRTIAVTTLYALSIMVRYMPSAWRRIEGGDEDQYLALVKAALAVWERFLPEAFLQSITNETVVTAQPGSIFS